MVLVYEKTFEKARNTIAKALKKNPKQKITFTSEDDELNRKILEKLGEQIDALLIIQSDRKDFMKQRNSGFNHVMAKVAKKNKVVIGICLDEIITKKEKEMAEILARVRQNIKICNKNKLRMKFVESEYSRNIYDLKALGIVLGMPSTMVKQL